MTIYVYLLLIEGIKMVILNFNKFFAAPKYIVMQGIAINNRILLFIRHNPIYSKDLYGNKIITFDGDKNTYYADNIYRRIRTMKQLIFWSRLLGKSRFSVVEKIGRRFKRITN